MGTGKAKGYGKLQCVGKKNHQLIFQNYGVHPDQNIGNMIAVVYDATRLITRASTANGDKVIDNGDQFCWQKFEEL